MGAMGIPAHDESYIKLEVELEQLRQQISQLTMSGTIGGFDTSRARGILDVRGQLSNDPYEQLKLGRERLGLIDTEVSNLQIIIARGQDKIELEDKINGLLLERKALAENLDQLAATTAHSYEAQQTSLAEAVTQAQALALAEQQRREALSWSMADTGDPRVRWMQFFKGIRDTNAQMILSGQLPASRIAGNNFNDPNLLGPTNGLELALMGGFGLAPKPAQSKINPDTGEMEQIKAKLTGMDYLSMFGMVSQLTGMGGKSGGIGQIASSYQTGVGLWSMLGGTGGGASMLGLGGGSIWGIAGVLIGGLSGLFQKNKVDYEKWLSKIANNTGKMAQAYDQAFSVGPRGLVAPAMAFGGLRGAF
jgi:hypothetical protein